MSRRLDDELSSIIIVVKLCLGHPVLCDSIVYNTIACI